MYFTCHQHMLSAWQGGIFFFFFSDVFLRSTSVYLQLIMQARRQIKFRFFCRFDSGHILEQVKLFNKIILQGSSLKQCGIFSSLLFLTKKNFQKVKNVIHTNISSIHANYLLLWVLVR